MKPIGYVVKMFPRLSETFIRNEILELERQGLELRIFSLKRPAEALSIEAGGTVRAPITYLPERVWHEPLRVLKAQFAVFCRHPKGYLRTLLHVLHGRELRSMGRGLRRFCQTCCLVDEMGEVRHLHAHFATDPTRLACWARMICGVSFSVTTHAKDLYQDNRIASPGLRYKFNQARFIVTNSQFSADGVRALLGNGTASKVVPIYNSVDMATFPRRKEEPLQPLILSAGRLVEKKGFADLIKACSVLKNRGTNFQCIIVGSGSLKEALGELVGKLSLNDTVRLRGQMAQNDLHSLYLEATVFALPCVVAANGDRDILPNVLKEAMAVGVPVVTTRLGGIEELVTDRESGLLVAPGDPESLASAIGLLLSDAGCRRRLAAQGRKTVEARFELATNFARLRDLLLDASTIYESSSYCAGSGDPACKTL